MPTNYTGSKTATQAPSPTPNPGVSPILSLPVDGDPENAASIAQAFKALADLADWLTKPQGKSGDWGGTIKRYRDALGHTRALVDHLGMPLGRIVQWDETWPGGLGAGQVITGSGGPWGIDGVGPIAYESTNPLRLADLSSALASASAAANFAAAQPFLATAATAAGNILLNAMPATGPWNVKAAVASGSVGASQVFFRSPDNADTKQSRYAALEAGDSNTDYVMLYRHPQANYTDDMVMILEWEMFVKAVPVPHRSVFVGFSEEGLLPTTHGSAQNYAGFEIAVGSSDWFISYANAGSTHSADTSIVATVGWHRMRLEFVGANVADDSTRSVRWYIDGVLAGAVSGTACPAAAAAASPHACVINTSGGASGVTDPLRVGPMKFRSNLYTAASGDVI